MGENTGICPKIVSSRKWGSPQKRRQKPVSSNKDSSRSREVKHCSLFCEVVKENATK